MSLRKLKSQIEDRTFLESDIPVQTAHNNHNNIDINVNIHITICTTVPVLEIIMATNVYISV